VRLNRYLSQCGVASRRGAEEIILGGRVSINGHIIKELATQVQPEDKVVVDGSPVRTETPLVIALNKPKGYLCSRGDTHERMTIYDLLPLKYPKPSPRRPSRQRKRRAASCSRTVGPLPPAHSPQPGRGKGI
jgi:16S rRNA U516 pseudouridylate synthase RsuA-like enzyme